MHGSSPSTTPVIADALSAFASQLRFEDIPLAIREQAKHHILDVVGICHAAAASDFAAKALTALRRLGGGVGNQRRGRLSHS